MKTADFPKLVQDPATTDSPSAVVFLSTSPTTNSCGTVAGAPSNGAPAAVPAAAASLLDKERENRFGIARLKAVKSRPEKLSGMAPSEWLRPGEVYIRPQRSGGPFDPMGARAHDVHRAQDMRAITQLLPGRWVFVTLTVNRHLFVSPELAYDRCNERVRRVMRDLCPRGVYFVAFEVQTKTGDGWPHWHVLAWVPDHRTEDQLRECVRHRWRIRERNERISEETGEVTQSPSIESIGFVHVETVRDNTRAGAYVSKYLTKPWPAVPAWMGESTRRLRKLRFSDECYTILERLYRHDRKRGSRSERVSDRPRRPVRPLFQRMAASGLGVLAFKRGQGGRMEFVGTLPVEVDEDGTSLLQRRGCEVVGLGSWGRFSGVMTMGEWLRVVTQKRAELANLQRERLDERVSYFRRQWHRYQRTRAGEADDDAPRVLSGGAEYRIPEGQHGEPATRGVGGPQA
jgi:hypothetical protein